MARVSGFAFYEALGYRFEHVEYCFFHLFVYSTKLTRKRQVDKVLLLRVRHQLEFLLVFQGSRVYIHVHTHILITMHTYTFLRMIFTSHSLITNVY
jgi:hypothetical protein